MYCWKCSFQHPEDQIVCPRCGSANAPGQSFATPPTVGSRRAHDLEVEYTRTHQKGSHRAGGFSLVILLLVIVVAGAVYSLAFGH